MLQGDFKNLNVRETNISISILKLKFHLKVSYPEDPFRIIALFAIYETFISDLTDEAKRRGLELTNRGGTFRLNEKGAENNVEGYLI